MRYPGTAAPKRAGRRSPVAQLAERPTVNRQVAGSSPAGGANPGPLIGLFLRARLNGRLHRYVVTDLCDEDVASARLPERACEFCPRPRQDVDALAGRVAQQRTP